MVGLGWIWGFVFPINKALWTSSYVLFTGGIGVLVLAGLTYLIDINNWKKPFWVFEVFGTNSIFLFVMSGLWTKTIIRIKMTFHGETVSAYSYFYKSILSSWWRMSTSSSIIEPSLLSSFKSSMLKSSSKSLKSSSTSTYGFADYGLIGFCFYCISSSGTTCSRHLYHKLINS